MTNQVIVPRKGANLIINRAVKGTPDYTEITKFRVSIDTPDATWADTELTTSIPITGTETVDDCSVTTGWTTTGGTVTVNTTTYKEDGGTDGALNLTKTGTASADVSTTKATTSVDATSKNLIMWFYIKDTTAYNKLTTSGTGLAIRFGSDSSNYYEKQYLTSALTAGWNYLTIATTAGFTTTTGTPTISAMDYTYIATTATTATDTWSDGDIIFDSIRVASSGDYLKDIESPPTIDENDASITWVSKLAVTEANGFLLNGLGLVNTDTAEILGVKTKFPNNSKNTTDLFKFTTKLKIRNINQVE